METVTVPPSRRERKKLATREALRTAALELTDEHGLSGVTIETITERADVAPRTFFNYFSSKEDAVLGHDPDRLGRIGAALRARPAEESALEALRAVLLDDLASRELGTEDLLRLVRLIRSEPHLLAAQAARWEEMERGVVAVVAERGGLDPLTDLYPSLVVGAAVAAIRASVMRWCDQGGRPSLPGLAGQGFDLLAAGLPAPGVGTKA